MSQSLDAIRCVVVEDVDGGSQTELIVCVRKVER